MPMEWVNSFILQIYDLSSLVFHFNIQMFQWVGIGKVWVFSLLLSPGTPICSTSETNRRDITKRLLKVALNTIVLLSQEQNCNVFIH
jgi:hypothetical protein